MRKETELISKFVVVHPGIAFLLIPIITTEDEIITETNAPISEVKLTQRNGFADECTIVRNPTRLIRE